MEISIPEKVTPALLEAVVDMESQVFSQQDCITRERAEWLFRLSPKSLILLQEGSCLVGFLSLFFVRETLAQKSVEIDTPIFLAIQPEDLNPPASQRDLYLYSVVLLPSEQGKGYSHFFYQGMDQWIQEQGSFRRIWADTVSDGGRRFVRGLGLKPEQEIAGHSLLCGASSNLLMERLNEKQR